MADSPGHVYVHVDVTKKEKWMGAIVIPGKQDVPGFEPIKVSNGLTEIGMEQVSEFKELEHKIPEEDCSEISKIVKNLYNVDLTSKIMKLISGVHFGIGLLDFAPNKGLKVSWVGNGIEKGVFGWLKEYYVKKYGFILNDVLAIGPGRTVGIYKTGNIVNNSEWRSIGNTLTKKHTSMCMYCCVSSDGMLRRIVSNLLKYLDVNGVLVMLMPLSMIGSVEIKVLIISFIECYIKVYGDSFMIVCKEKDNGFECLYADDLNFEYVLDEKLSGKIDSRIRKIVDMGVKNIDWMNLYGY